MLLRSTIISISVFFAGCQTLKPLDSSEIPLSVLESFDACHGQDGGLIWKYEAKDYGGFSADLDWVSKTEGKWIAEFIDPVGRTVLTLNANRRYVRFSGSVASRIPLIDIDEDGFYKLGDYWLGIRNDEFPCYLNFGVPRQWLILPGAWKVNGRSGQLVFEDESREVRIRYKKRARKWIPSCIEVDWNNYSFVPDDYSVCYESENGKKRAVLDYSGEFLMKWESYE